MVPSCSTISYRAPGRLPYMSASLSPTSIQNVRPMRSLALNAAAA
jgi:hypothetical protein